MLHHGRWLEFVEKINGREEVTKYFEREYDKIEEEIGDMNLVLIWSFVLEATRFPRIGEKWFKNKRIQEKNGELFSII